jgi:hypothetical protein
LNWLIIRTDKAKEHYVAAQIRNLTFDAWVPCQIIVSRPSAARRISSKAQLRAIKELPILPRRIFAAVPSWAVLQGELAHIRHLAAVEHDGASRPIYVPPAEIARFRAAIDAENTAALALAQKASRKQKAKWRSLHDALLDMIDSAKAQMEQAA